MSYRSTDNLTSGYLKSRINSQRLLVSAFRERITTGKRINRPSDDPAGAELVIKLKTTQTEVEHFKRAASFAGQKLSATDEAIANYSNILDRVKTLTAQGLSDTATQAAKNAIATELGALRERILNNANQKYGDEYLFGGNRASAPPFDPTTATTSLLPANPQYLQIEPGTNAVEIGEIAENLFSDTTSTIFADLDSAITALRGTGNATADRAALENAGARFQAFGRIAGASLAKIGAISNTIESAQERLSGSLLNLDGRINETEGADFAESALKFAEAQRALEATLQVAATSRRNLFDFLG